MATYQIHNVGFFNLPPRSITCLAHEATSKKIALSRSDNLIEIWNIKNIPFLESTLSHNRKNSIESLLWIDPNRLLSTGLSGMIVEYNLPFQQMKYEVAVTGGAAWCMDINSQKTRIAVGTEDGYVNVFTVAHDYLVYEKIFDKQKGRILCLKWATTGDMIFTGSVDTVRVWNANTGHAVHKMTTARKQIKKETIVWCLGVTDDNNVISGDSRGVLSIWDSSTGTLIESHQSHNADILALAVSHDSNVIYIAGIDPVVRSFSRVVLKYSGRTQWVRGIERRLHVHDVRALVEADGKLYSAGVDSYLAQSSYPPKVLVKYPPLPSTSSVTLCRKSRCLMLCYTNYLELWRLGRSNSLSELISQDYDARRHETAYPLDEKPIKLLELRPKKNESIVSYAITKDSKIIVYSSETHARVFNFDIIDGDTVLTKSDADIGGKTRIQKMLFSPNNKLFITVKTDENVNMLTVFTVENKRFKVKASFDTAKQNLSTIGLMCFAPDNKYLICADLFGYIVVYTVDDYFICGSPKYWTLPTYNCPPTAMAVQQNTLNLIVVYSDHKIIEYNLRERQYTKFSDNLRSYIPGQWFTRSFPIINITFDPNNEDIIILYDDATVYIVNKNNELPVSATKMTKSECNEDDSNSTLTSSGPCGFHVIKKYKHLLHLDWLKNGELVAVEVNPISITEKLPPILKQKRFAAS